jgi:hypothetical protein
MSTGVKRGRPPLAWLAGDALALLPVGTAVSVELQGRHGRRLVGRITGVLDGHLELDTTGMGEVSVALISIKRGRVVPALYEPGDPVLLRHVPASTWRGGVVRTDGSDVLVEQIDGSFAWHAEADLEPAEAREPALPPLPRGPIPARA